MACSGWCGASVMVQVQAVHGPGGAVAKCTTAGVRPAVTELQAHQRIEAPRGEAQWASEKESFPNREHGIRAREACWEVKDVPGPGNLRNKKMEA